MQIHSATPHTASIEQIFSQFGVKHSKHQNWTHPEKIQKEMLLKTNMMAAYMLPLHHKCKFGVNNKFDNKLNELVPITGMKSQTNDCPFSKFTSLTCKLVTEAAEDNIELKIKLTPAPQLAQQPAPAMALTLDQLTLKSLFHYPPSTDQSSISSKVLTGY
ncbi:hypothetical protein DXG03_002560 [Asterophora parasitica]|uniref:Uncharacterized protein n=1 Tax=Asterophora parasitica TaxID=117018 RepID=A0A9P7G2X7_9AGAR|nr:hypothetical protein DXG03_002560 [Asterophora parasitica]